MRFMLFDRNFMFYKTKCLIFYINACFVFFQKIKMVYQVDKKEHF